MENKKKISYLESLRGIAALMVAISHFRIDSLIYQNQFVGNSYLWVDFFFVLSGFVIALNYQFNIKNSKDLYVFQAKRFLRLYPLHIIMLLMFLGLECAEYLKELILDNAGIASAFSKNSFEAFIHNLFLTHNIFLKDVSWNYPSWSISAEFYTYFIFGLIVLFSRGSIIFAIFISIFLTLISFFILLYTSMDTSMGVIRCLLSFFLGVIIFNINKISSFEIPAFFSYVIFLFAILGIYFSGPSQTISLNIFMPIVFSALIFSLLRSESNNRLIEILNINFLIFLGAISYSIYMIHALLWRVISIFLRYVANIEGSEELAMISNNEFLSGIILIGSVAVLILASNFSFKYIELKYNEYRKFL
tara:strand:+ start:8218 stop:9303 length:1086 start_codon:yes stop_codon:yes gene_type:complete